jgi:cobyrinic acid a,c-diamide synthase
LTNRRLVIAGTGSGVGKTTLTIGIMSALMKQGYKVQGFKCGPDYIDPTYHTAVTGRRSHNLDSWMLSHDIVREILKRQSEDADISIIEGVMGFYDGKNPKTNEGSTADVSLITESPVILVVDCGGMARSAAAIVKGFQSLSDDVQIAGVIANKVGGEGHFRLIKMAVEQDCHIPVIGYLNKSLNLDIPERHLGLIPAIERGELDSFFDELGEAVSQTVDLSQLYEIAKAPSIEIKESLLFQKKSRQNIVRIAVPQDAAFNFYYPENIELLEAYGAKCVFFSPLKGEGLPPDIHGLYLGGGFPEEFAADLAGQHEVKSTIKAAIELGVPAFAECGGFMYLSEAIQTTDGNEYPMVGVIPGVIKMQKRLAAIGYREIKGEQGNYLLNGKEQARGHEFHYSTFHPTGEIEYAYQTKGMRGIQQEGFVKHNLIGGYTHIHFASCPGLVERWIEKCLDWKTTRIYI